MNRPHDNKSSTLPIMEGVSDDRGLDSRGRNHYIRSRTVGTQPQNSPVAWVVIIDPTQMVKGTCWA